MTGVDNYHKRKRDFAALKAAVAEWCVQKEALLSPSAMAKKLCVSKATFDRYVTEWRQENIRDEPRRHSTAAD